MKRSFHNRRVTAPVRTLLIVALMLAPTELLADVLRCKIEGYTENIFITTPPDTASSDGQHGGIGISPGIGGRAIVFADRMGAVAFGAEYGRHTDWAAYGSEEYTWQP